MLIAGARPNFMKVAPVAKALAAVGVSHVLVHTGQHYDEALSDAIWRDLELPAPDYHLGIGSASHAIQTARIMTAFEPVLNQVRPRWVVVVGDVNSTLACALVTAKLKHALGCRLAHVEAGLRSRDWRMPEEVNRVLTDRLCDLLLTPSRDADANLLAEGIEPERITFVGNVMIDVLLSQLDRARTLDIAERLGLERGRYVAVTLHRPSNVDSRDTLQPILEGLVRVNREARVVLPLHPRTRGMAETFGLTGMLDELLTLPPVSYLEMVSLVDGASVVMTDSGGLQEETTVLGIPCVTLREQTERPVTVTQGTNRMLQWPPTAQSVLEGFLRASEAGRTRTGARQPEGWDGSASTRIVRAMGQDGRRGQSSSESSL
jgi:UDP-N-acetylglucosamine 2-epimerase (non-hydrolysing)